MNGWDVSGWNEAIADGRSCPKHLVRIHRVCSGNKKSGLGRALFMEWRS